MTNDEAKAVGCLAGIPAVLVVWPINAALYGFTLSKLWLWFIVPIFGLPRLGVLQAIGCALVVHLFTLRRSSGSKDDEKSLLEVAFDGLLFGVLVCGVSLIEGWIVLRLLIG